MLAPANYEGATATRITESINTTIMMIAAIFVIRSAVCLSID